MLKSPVIITWELLFETFENNRSLFWTELFNNFVITIMTRWSVPTSNYDFFSGRDSPVTSLKNPSHSFEFVCTL